MLLEAAKIKKKRPDQKIYYSQMIIIPSQSLFEIESWRDEHKKRDGSQSRIFANNMCYAVLDMDHARFENYVIINKIISMKMHADW